jgi:hypothetical protein
MPVRVLSGASANLPVGGIWEITLQVVDDWGVWADDVPVIEVTAPGGGVVAPTAEHITSGVYRAEVIPAVAGRFTARAVTALNGAADLTAWATAITPASAMPDLIDLVGTRDADDSGYLGPNSFTDDEVEDALAAEAAAQRAVCRVPAAYPDDLRQAVLRRVAVNLAKRALPLAIQQGDAEAGTSNLYVPGRDPEVRRFEGPYRRMTVG